MLHFNGVKYDLISTNQTVAFQISLKLAFKTQWKDIIEIYSVMEKVTCYQRTKYQTEQHNEKS